MSSASPVNPEEIRAFIEEDLGAGDLTANLIPEGAVAKAEVVTRERMVMCGQAWFAAVFTELDPMVRISWNVAEGDEVEAGSTLCTMAGRARPMLTGERTALNLLQTLCATATVSRVYAQAVAGTGCKVLDTRKTLPGLRRAQKYAVKCGGCNNHRIGLFDGILIKENHIAAAGSIAAAVSRARDTSPGLPVEVEVENFKELHEALEARADRILLDNFDTDMLRRAVAVVAGHAELEASGNVSLQTIRTIAETGVNFVSVGALTKDVRAVDLSMRIVLKRPA